VHLAAYPQEMNHAIIDVLIDCTKLQR
jgi:hypothetical protein